MRRHLFISLLTLLCLRLGTAHAAGVVTTCDESSLRAALAGGGTVTFACDGTITLAKTLVIDTNTTLDATGHNVTLDGNKQVQVIKVNSGRECDLTNLVIADGLATVDDSAVLGGGGVFNEGGIMHLTHCALNNNVMVGAGFAVVALGGGFLNLGGNVTLDNCVFSGNLTDSSSAMVSGGGGLGLYNDGGSSTLTNCAFLGNVAQGIADDFYGFGYYTAPIVGGGLANHGGNVTLLNCVFSQNTAVGDAGFRGNGPGAGDGSEGQGGALYNDGGSITSTNCTFAANQAMGGDGALGDPDSGNQTTDGGNGSNGLGGAIYNASGTQVLINCTLAGNAVSGGAGGQATYLDTIRGQDGTPGTGHGGIAVAGGNVVLYNTLLGPNGDVNVYGTIGDRGHNLSSDGTPRFGPHSLNNAFTGLGPLANNGGPTQTFGLYTHSQAIDTADNSACPATDQRGVARPQGNGCDIGAFEGTIADTTNPTVSITLPVDKAARPNLNAIRGTAADNSGPGGVARVDVFIQRQSDKKYWTGTGWGAMTPLGTTLTNNATQWARLGGNPSGANLTDGLYTIQAIAYDQSGNASALATITTRIDQTAPIVAITTPMSGANLAVLPVLRGTATDNPGGSGIDRVELLLQRGSDHKYWTGQAWSATPTILPTSYAGGKWSHYDQLLGGSDFVDLINDTYLLVARAYDRAGNVARSQSIFTVTQNIGPDESLVVISSAHIDPDTRLITLTFSDALDPTSASSPASYVVSQNDSAFTIQSVAYDSAHHAVTIDAGGGDFIYTLPLMVAWQGLLDVHKKKVRDDSVTLTVLAASDDY